MNVIEVDFRKEEEKTQEIDISERIAKIKASLEKIIELMAEVRVLKNEDSK